VIIYNPMFDSYDNGITPLKSSCEYQSLNNDEEDTKAKSNANLNALLTPLGLGHQVDHSRADRLMRSVKIGTKNQGLPDKKN
jgi:hypothetical protein